jgi:hypothetical protein
MDGFGSALPLALHDWRGGYGVRHEDSMDQAWSMRMKNLEGTRRERGANLAEEGNMVSEEIAGLRVKLGSQD